MVPSVRPVNEPVSVPAPAFVKVGLNKMELAETVTLPTILALPVTGVASARPAKYKANKAGVKEIFCRIVIAFMK